MNALTRHPARVLRSAVAASLALAFFTPTGFAAETPATSLLVLEKKTTQLDIVDPVTLKVLAHVPVGDDCHEVIASPDGKIAYVSNYNGPNGPHYHLARVDLIAQKALPPLELGALEAPHGLYFAGGKLYITTEGSKTVDRYDPASDKIDWVIGTGQDRTHMVWVAPTLDKIVTTNILSASVSIIESHAPPSVTEPQLFAPRTTWTVTNVSAGHGAEGFDISPDGKQLWVANGADSTVTVIDLASKTTLDTFPVTAKLLNRLKFSPDGKYALITGVRAAPDLPNLVVVDVATHKQIKQFNLGGGATGILIDPTAPRAFVAVSGADKVVVFDLKSLEPKGQIAGLGEPDGMAWAVRK